MWSRTDLYDLADCPIVNRDSDFPIAFWFNITRAALTAAKS